MFGFLYALFVGGAHIVKGIQDAIENDEFKKKYRHNDAGVYYDNKMRKHDQKTGRIVTYEKDIKTGDVWVVDALSCRRLRNLTQNEVEAHYQEERQKFLEGKTARTYVQYGQNLHHNDECPGVRYKDLQTGRLFVVRYIDRYGFDEKFCETRLYNIGLYCLMDVETGEFIRPTDNILEMNIENSNKKKYHNYIIRNENDKKKKRLKILYDKKDNTIRDYKYYVRELYSVDKCEIPSYGCCEELSDESNNFLIGKGKMLI